MGQSREVWEEWGSLPEVPGAEEQAQDMAALGQEVSKVSASQQGENKPELPAPCLPHSQLGRTTGIRSKTGHGELT